MTGRVCVGGLADVVGVDRDVAPAEHALALDADVELEQRLELRRGARRRRQEADRDAVAAGVGQLEVDDRAEERVRAAAAASRRRRRCARRRPWRRGARGSRRRCRPLSTTSWVGHVVQAGDERDAARVVLVAGVVEAGGLWRRGLVRHGSASRRRRVAL